MKRVENISNVFRIDPERLTLENYLCCIKMFKEDWFACYTETRISNKI